MKQKNKEIRLRARIRAYDDLIKKDSRYASCTTKPRSMRK
jgi:hypothetical protein